MADELMPWERAWQRDERGREAVQAAEQERVLGDPNAPWNKVYVAPTASPGSLTENLAAGANEGVIKSNPVSAAVDVGTWLMGQTRQGWRRMTGQEPLSEEEMEGLYGNPVLGSDWVMDRLGGIAPGMDPRTTQADTQSERVARGAGAGMGSMIGPYGYAAALRGAGVPISDFTMSMLRPGDTVPRAVGATFGQGAIPGAASALTAEQEWIPDWARPSASVAAGLAAAGIGGVGQAVAEGIPAGLSAAVRYPLLGKNTEALTGIPGSNTVRDAAAVRRFESAATSPAAVRDTLNNEAPFELVEGSNPTTFQATGDMGLGSAERGLQNLRPDEMRQIAADQNAARIKALEGLTTDADAMSVSTYLRERLVALEEDAIRFEQGQIQTTQDMLSRMGTPRTPQEVGSILRSSLQSARDAAKAEERALWDAVDPDGSLTIPGGTVRDAAMNVRGEMADAAKPMTGEEAAIFEAAEAFGDVVPFSELIALRSRLSTELRAELQANGSSPAYRRLTILRGQVEGAIDNAVQNRVAMEQAGDVPVDVSLVDRLIQERDAWLAERTGESAAAAVGAGPGSVSGPSGGQGAAGVGPDGAPGNQAVPEAPTVDTDAASRLAAASTATRERAQTFDAGVPGNILRRNGQGGDQPYRLLDSLVAGKIFHNRPTSAEDIQAFRTAIGDDAAALTALRDYAVTSMRNASLNANGTINPQRFQTWLNQHRDALRAMPELEQGFRNLMVADNTMAEAAAVRREAVENAEIGAFGRLVGANDPATTVRTVGTIFSGPNSSQIMRDLVQPMTIPGPTYNQEALNGLRNAVSEFMAQRFVGNTEVGTSGVNAIKSDAFQTFVRTNRDALTTLYSEAQVRTLEAIAADLARSNRSIVSVRIPGQSNTTQDVAQLGRDPTRSIFGRMFLESKLGQIATDAGGIGGAALGVGFQRPSVAIAAMAGWIGAKAVNALRQAGLENVEDVYAMMLKDPNFARIMLERYPTRGDTGAAYSIPNALRRWATLQTARVAGEE